MKTETVKESPAFVLQGSSYNGAGVPIKVSYAELRTAAVGTIWAGYDNHGCGRDLSEESAEVVYKTEEGAAVLFRAWGTTDEPNPTDWENKPVLRWYEFA